MTFLCVSQQGTRGVQKHHKKNFLGEIDVKSIWPKKSGENKNPVVFFLRSFLSRFWLFLCMRSPKTP
jgi:hypothetical protein